MATAKKLPSGKWRVQATRTINGKKTTKSFTATTPFEAEQLAKEWQKHIDMIGNDSTTLTVKEAVEEYIAIKSNILSISTIAGYKKHLRNGFLDLHHLPLNRLTNVTIQKSINNASKTLSTKSLKNYYGLLFATLKMFYPEFSLSVSFPPQQKKQKQPYTKDFVQTLIKTLEGSSVEIPALIAIMLSCRASEIAGLKWSDINENNQTITIQRAKLIDENNNYILQERTKTYNSNRTVFIPDYLYKKLLKEKQISKSEFITDVSPEKYRSRLTNLLNKNNLPHIRFHDLRHLSASIMLSLGINNQIAQEIGGWSTDNIMKSVYQHTFNEERQKANNELNVYFNNIQKNNNKNEEVHTKIHTNKSNRFKIKRFTAILR